MDQSLHNHKWLKTNRKGLRHNATTHEKMLWQFLKGQKLGGHKFRRQHSIGPYIVDFYCAEQSLVIELDGADHFTPTGKQFDQQRDDFMHDKGYQVLRFTNSEVERSMDSVLQRIMAACKR